MVGTDPDYLGRSRRLVGLLVDRGFGVAAWQPARLLCCSRPARPGQAPPVGWAALALPLAAGWLVATFVALTMHGWRFAGRQVVVVLPLAALAVAWWTGPDGRRRLLLAVAGGAGAGPAVAGRRGAAGRITWAVDSTATAGPLYKAWRLHCPTTWPWADETLALHGAWLVALTAWTVVAARGWTGHPPPSVGSAVRALEDLTGRRRAVRDRIGQRLASLGLGLALLLAGCGNDDGLPGSATSMATRRPAAAPPRAAAPGRAAAPPRDGRARQAGQLTPARATAPSRSS